MGRYLVGQRLDEYSVLSLLQDSGTTLVYLGMDLTLKRHATIKVFDAPFRVDAENAESMRREAHSVGQLRHPNIVTLYRFGQSSGRLYAATESVDGADLQTVLSSFKADGEHLPLEDVARIVGEVGQAMDYAHANGVIHGDLKSSSILLDRKGHCRVADFGLATMLALGTGEAIGRSPTDGREEPPPSAGRAGSQGDLYALGLVLYEMITNEPPPQDESPPTLRRHRPEASFQLESVVGLALAGDPEERFQTGAELSDALGEALGLTPSVTAGAPATGALLQRVAQAAIEGAVSSPRPAGLPPVEVEDVVPPRRRRTKTPLIIAAGVLLGLCVAIAALVGLVWFADRLGREKLNQQAGIEFYWPFASKTVEPTTSLLDIPSPLPSATGFAFPTTVAPTQSPSPTAAEATAVPTLPPTETPTAAPPTLTLVPPSLTVQIQIVTYNLVVAVKDGEGVVVVNQGPESFPLAPLALDNGSVVGSDWGVSQLAPGDCVVVWSDARDQPVYPDGIACRQVGDVLVLIGRERLWRTTFNIIYDGIEVGVCGRDQTICPISIAANS